VRNPFKKVLKKYTRDLDIIGNYAKAMAKVLSISTGTDYDKALAFVKSEMHPKEPRIRALVKTPGGDREKRIIKLTPLLTSTMHKNRYLSPSGVVYENPEVDLAPLAEFQELGMANRSKAKAKKFEALMAGDADGELFYDNTQQGIKVKINTVSGACDSAFNPLYNPSGHTTLSSNGRVVTSYSNATVSRMLMGNRHYLSADILIADIVTSLSAVDIEASNLVVSSRGLYVPSALELADVLITCLRRYDRSPAGAQKAREFIFALTPEQRAVAAYTADLHTLNRFNPVFTKGLITSLAFPEDMPQEVADAEFENASAEMVIHMGLANYEETRGVKISTAKEKKPEVYKHLSQTAASTAAAVVSNADVFETWFTTDYMNPNIYDYTESLRIGLPLSDTDSTVYSVEEWVINYFGANRFDQAGVAVASSMSYLFSSYLTHVLINLSKQLGVVDRHLELLAMKGEFYIPALAVPLATKHYFMYIAACEGNVYNEYDFEAKGVNLKNSRLPEKVINELNDYMKYVLDVAMDKHGVDMRTLLAKPVEVAKNVVNTTDAGDPSFSATITVQHADSYKGDNNPTYKQHLFWKTAFSDDYGYEEPPYIAYKLPVKLTKKSEVVDFLNGCEPEFRAKFERAMELTGKVKFTNIHIPATCLKEGRVPTELIPIIDSKRTEATVTTGFLIALETCGVFRRNKHKTRRLSEERI